MNLETENKHVKDIRKSNHEFVTSTPNSYGDKSSFANQNRMHAYTLTRRPQIPVNPDATFTRVRVQETLWTEGFHNLVLKDTLFQLSILNRPCMLLS